MMAMRDGELSVGLGLDRAELWGATDGYVVVTVAGGEGFEHDFDTLEDAMAYYESGVGAEVEYLELLGPGVELSRENPDYDPEAWAEVVAASRRADLRELALEAGMGLGVAAYNDMMDQSLDAVEDEYDWHGRRR